MASEVCASCGFARESGEGACRFCGSVPLQPCPICGTAIPHQARCCPHCGGARILGAAPSPPVEQAAASPPTPQPTISSPPPVPPATAPKRQLPPILAWGLGAGCLLTVVLLVGIAMGVGGFRLPGGRPVVRRPLAPLPTSGTAPVDITPIPGIRVTAAANALDRERTFSGTLLSPAETASLAARTFPEGMLPLTACRLEAGTGARDLFPGAVSIRFDLAELGLDGSLADRVDVLHLREDGTLQRMVVKSEGGAATVRARGNGVWFVAIAAIKLTSIAVSVFTPALALYEQYEQHGSLDGQDQNWGDTEHFVFYWNRGTPAADPAAGQLFDRWRDLNRRRTRLATARRGPGDAEYDQVVKERDEAGRQLKALAPDEATARKKIWPTRVQEWAESLERSWEYLVKLRGFREPGYRIEVFLRDPWVHGTADAMTLNMTTTRPFIDVNPGLANGDERHLTSVHELFHVIQKEYFTWEFQGYGWFMEATARALERDAQTHFVGRGYAAAWPLTPRTYAVFQQPLDQPEEGNDIHHGYGASAFLEFLQDRYYPGKAQDFLPRVMDDFSGLRGGTIASLVRATSNDDAQMAKDFQEFCDKYAWEIHALTPGSRTVTLTPASPVMDWKLPTTQPLCAATAAFTITGVPAAKQASVKILVREKDQSGIPLVTRFSSDGRKLTAAAKGEVVGTPNWRGSTQFYVQRLEPYTPAAVRTDFRPMAGYGSTQVIGLLPPPAPLSARKEGKFLRIRWTESPLARAGVLRETRVLITPPVGPRLTYRATSNEISIPAKELGELQQTQELGDLRRQLESSVHATIIKHLPSADLRDALEIRRYMDHLRGTRAAAGDPNRKRWRVALQEVPIANTLVVGPEGDELAFSEDLDELDPGNFDVSGEWRGRILLTDIHVRLVLREGDGALQGTGQVLGEKPEPISGKWDGGKQAWVMGEKHPLPKNIPPELVPLLEEFQTPKIRRFPDERIWIEFPPVLLRREVPTPPPVPIPNPTPDRTRYRPLE